MDKHSVVAVFIFFVMCFAFMVVDLCSETTVYRCTDSNEVVYFSNRKPPEAKYKTCTESQMLKGSYYNAKNSGSK
jgi:hypothetical protein